MFLSNNQAELISSVINLWGATAITFIVVALPDNVVPAKRVDQLSQVVTAIIIVPESEGNCIYWSQWNFAELVEVVETCEVRNG